MARVDTLGHFLTDVADAIRTKTGSSDTITASDFDTEIENIPSGGDVSDYFTSTLKSASGSSFSFNGITDAIKKIPNMTPYGNSLAYACYRCNALEEVSISNIDTVTTMEQAFRYCGSLKSVSLTRTFASLNNISNIFANCTSLTTVPNFDVSRVKNAGNMFRSCSSLTSIPSYNFSSTLTDTQNMFNGCSALTTVPLFTTSSNGNFTYMFSGCTSLTTLPQFDMSAITNANLLGNYVANCPSLSTASLENVIKSLDNSGIVATSNTLASIGLSSTQATYCTTLPEWSSLSSKGWTTGY